MTKPTFRLHAGGEDRATVLVASLSQAASARSQSSVRGASCRPERKLAGRGGSAIGVMTAERGASESTKSDAPNGERRAVRRASCRRA